MPVKNTSCYPYTTRHDKVLLQHSRGGGGRSGWEARTVVDGDGDRGYGIECEPISRGGGSALNTNYTLTCRVVLTAGRRGNFQ